MVDIIKEKLREIERQNDVRILYACESGSRAWGFPSPDSDFDVRFIYAGKRDDYLSIIDKTDVIDLPVNDLLDIGGWDIRKALKLFLKSNGPLYEWLQSPIVYCDVAGFADNLRQLMPKYFSLRAGGHHYLSMALNTVNNDLQGEEAKLKRYFYAIRSALSCKWITENQSVPPMELAPLRKSVVDENFQLAVDGFLAVKKESDEKTLVKRNAVLDSWLAATLSACKGSVSDMSVTRNQPDELNDLFRKYLS